jgi:hypothetical protein
VKETLIKDVLLFQELQLMDYSLLVMKIDWGLYEKQIGNLPSYVAKLISSQTHLQTEL